MSIGTVANTAVMPLSELSVDYLSGVADTDTATLTTSDVNVGGAAVTTTTAGDYWVVGRWGWDSLSAQNALYVGTIYEGATARTTSTHYVLDDTSSSDYVTTTTASQILTGVGSGVVLKLMARNNTTTGGRCLASYSSILAIQIG